MKEENYLEGIYGCLERIEKKVETLPVEGTSPAVGNRTSSPEGIAELKIRHGKGRQGIDSPRAAFQH